MLAVDRSLNVEISTRNRKRSITDDALEQSDEETNKYHTLGEEGNDKMEGEEGDNDVSVAHKRHRGHEFDPSEIYISTSTSCSQTVPVPTSASISVPTSLSLYVALLRYRKRRVRQQFAIVVVAVQLTLLLMSKPQRL